MRSCFEYKFFWVLIVLLSTFSTNLYSQCTDNSNVWVESWKSCATSTNPNPTRGTTHWLLIEFAEPQAISTTQIWNANRIGESGMGGKDVFVDVSSDGTSWTQIGTGAYTWPQAAPCPRRTPAW